MISVTIFFAPVFHAPRPYPRRVSNRSLKLGGFSYISIIRSPPPSREDINEDSQKRGKKEREREREKKERKGWTDYRISGRANKTRVATKIFVSRGPIKPISASGMRFVFRPRENNFDYFSGYAMATRWLLLVRRKLSLSKLRHCPYGKWIFPAEGNASRGFVYGNWKSKRRMDDKLNADSSWIFRLY